MPAIGKDRLGTFHSFGARLLLNLARCVSQQQMPFYRRRIIAPLGGMGAQLTLSSYFRTLWRLRNPPVHGTWVPQL